MLRVTILGLAASLAYTSTICSQEMRTDLKQFGLAGNVQSVETHVATMSTKSYKLGSGGREELEDFHPDDSLALTEFLKFDAKGKLLEDIDAERAMDQESYRYIYVYNQLGLLVERAGFREDGSPDEKAAYVYDPEGKKIEEFYYSNVGRLISKMGFDERENVASVESYGEDGQISHKEIHRYEYIRRGNILEQIYYPPERPGGIGLILLRAPETEKPTEVTLPVRYRTVFISDDLGRMREECHYDTDGSLHEKKTFDQNGILTNREWRLGDWTVTTTKYDAQGRELESHTIAKQGFLSRIAIDHVSVSSYDEHGNVIEMITTGPDGSLLRRTVNVYEYDAQGNWINKTETELNNTWQTEPFPAAWETVRRYHRTISYFP